MIPIALNSADARYPARLRRRLRTDALPQLSALGNLDLLALSKTALFCSARCPGRAILAVYDQVTRWRDAGRCIISGFHSPVEKECLRILLRGSQPIIICPARSLEKLRLAVDWQKSFDRWPYLDSLLFHRRQPPCHDLPRHPPQ
jgi:hypothetical protein